MFASIKYPKVYPIRIYAYVCVYQQQQKVFPIRIYAYVCVFQQQNKEQTRHNTQP